MNRHFEEAFKRIEAATGIKTMTELAKIVGSSQQYISKKSREGAFPVVWAHEVAKKYGLSTDWIMTGEGPRRLSELQHCRKFEMLNEFEEWLTEEVRKKPSRKEWFEIQLLDSFQPFKKWIEAKNEILGKTPEVLKQSNGSGWK